MTRAWVVPLVLQVATPAALLVWQAAARYSTLAGWAFRTAIVAAYLVAAVVAGLWLAVPPTVCAALFATSALIAVRRYPWSRLRREPGSSLRVFLVLAGRVVVLGLVLSVVAVALLGRRVPGLASIDLEFPLRDGTYYIANGGSMRLINAHTALLGATQFAHYRGAGYGLDIVKLNVTGTHATGLAPRDPARYVIFGEPIYAPCEGIVARSEDGLPDMAPPEVDRAHMPGNFVLLECGDAHVLLAHMRRDTVNVHPGDYVTLDTKLGEVGNSGNSDAPHLHVHAQRAGQMWDIFNADPLPVRFNGRFLVRNDRMTVPPAESEPIDD